MAVRHQSVMIMLGNNINKFICTKNQVADNRSSCFQAMAEAWSRNILPDGGWVDVRWKSVLNVISLETAIYLSSISGNCVVQYKCATLVCTQIMPHRCRSNDDGEVPATFFVQITGRERLLSIGTLYSKAAGLVSPFKPKRRLTHFFKDNPCTLVKHLYDYRCNTRSSTIEHRNGKLTNGLRFGPQLNESEICQYVKAIESHEGEISI